MFFNFCNEFLTAFYEIYLEHRGFWALKSTELKVPGPLFYRKIENLMMKVNGNECKS